MSKEQAYCACLKVKYAPEEVGDGLPRERWVCSSCGSEFQKKKKTQPAVQADACKCDLASFGSLAGRDFKQRCTWCGKIRTA